VEVLDRLAVQRVLLPFPAEPVVAGVAELDFLRHGGPEAGVVPRQRLGRDLEVADALDLARGSGEGEIGQAAAQADGLEDLGALIALQAGNAHLRHDLEHSLFEGRAVLAQRLVERFAPKNLAVHVLLQQLAHGVGAEVRADRLGAVAEQTAHLVHVAGLAGVDDDRQAQPLGAPHQVVVDGTGRQQRGHRHPVVIDRAIGQDEDADAIVDRLFGLGAEPVDGGFEAGFALVDGPGGIEGAGRKVGPQRLQLFQLVIEEERRVEPDDLGVFRGLGEEVAVPAEGDAERHDEAFADRVDRRVGDLGEELFEVGVEDARLQAEHREGGVVAHAVGPFHAVLDHRREDHVEFLVGVAEGRLLLGQTEDVERLGGRGNGGAGHAGELHAVLGEPVGVRMAGGQGLFDFAVEAHRLGHGVDHHAFPGASRPFWMTVLVIDRPGRLRSRRRSGRRG
jgi:hypothetical protein